MMPGIELLSIVVSKDISILFINMDEVGSAGTSEVSRSVNVINDWSDTGFPFELIEILLVI